MKYPSTVTDFRVRIESSTSGAPRTGQPQQLCVAYRPNNISPNPSPRIIEIMNEAFCVLPIQLAYNRPHDT